MKCSTKPTPDVNENILNMFEYFLEIISLGVVILSFFVSNFVQNICPRCPIRLKDKLNYHQNM